MWTLLVAAVDLWTGLTFVLIALLEQNLKFPELKHHSDIAGNLLGKFQSAFAICLRKEAFTC